MEDEKIYFIEKRDFGRCYSSYTSFLERHCPEVSKDFVYGECISNPSARYHIITEAPHESIRTPIAVIRETNRQQIYMVDRRILKEE